MRHFKNLMYFFVPAAFCINPELSPATNVSLRYVPTPVLITPINKIPVVKEHVNPCFIANNLDVYIVPDCL